MDIDELWEAVNRGDIKEVARLTAPENRGPERDITWEEWHDEPRQLGRDEQDERDNPRGRWWL